MHRLRHDLDHATSTGLLIAAVLTGITGLVSDAWDLNDFWPHIIAGYVMGGLAIAHVWFNWGRLVDYLRFRYRSLLRRGDDGRPPAPAAPRRRDRVELADPPPSALLARSRSAGAA